MAEQYHIKLSEKDTAKYAILPGDPGRVPLIANYLDNPKFVNQNREFCTWEGYVENEKVLVMSTGIGGPSAAIAMEELIKIGVKYFIRIGTCGGMQKDVLPGDIVIANGAIRMDGTTKEYLPIEFPAVADFEVLCAIKEACDILGFRHHVGVVQCKDNFYGQHDPLSSGISYELVNKWNSWKDSGCLASEMESSTVFVISALRKVKSGALFHCVWNQEIESSGLPENRIMDAGKAIEASVLALRILIALNKETKKE